MTMQRERLSPTLLAELFDCEEDAYRLSVRQAARIGWGPPALALRAVVAHANESLETLPGLAAERRVQLHSMGALAADTWRRVRDAAVDPFIDQEHAYRRTLTALRSGNDLVRLVRTAAANEGDEDLEQWCARWLETRDHLVEDVAAELAWFARHPFFARLTRLTFSPA